MFVKPKKHLGQHFLIDKGIAEQIVALLSGYNGYKIVIEIGAGTGVLTEFLVQNPQTELHLIDIDDESVKFLQQTYPELQAQGRIIAGDFLKMPLDTQFPEPFGIIGNFPYNISSQIFFKVLEHRNQVQEVVCMLQKEVALRIASKPGGREYGILSVFLQAFYDIEYHFTVAETVFNPPPKVKSGVISLKRNQRKNLDCDEKAFFRTVKQAFGQRRKTLRNALKAMGIPEKLKANIILDKRAEQLSVEDFMWLTNEMTEKEK